MARGGSQFEPYACAYTKFTTRVPGHDPPHCPRPPAGWRSGQSLPVRAHRPSHARYVGRQPPYCAPRPPESRLRLQCFALAASSTNATDAAGRSLTARPPPAAVHVLVRVHIHSPPLHRFQCASKQLPLCSSGGAGHAFTSGVIHPGVEATPSPPAPVLHPDGSSVTPNL